MTKLMRWKKTDSTENMSGLVLEMTVDGHNWYHYTNPLFSKYKQPENNIKGASKGFTTAQHCLKLGFKYVDKDGNLIN